MGKSKLTVFFDDHFQAAVYERITDNKLEVAKVVFGAEPKDNEVYDFFLNNWSRLKFSSPVEQEEHTEKKINPKRIQREIKNQLKQTGMGTKSQQALKLQQEQNKLERKTIRKIKTLEEKQRQFALRQQKKKEKRMGK